MSKASPLFEQLKTAIAPHLGSADTASPKAVAKTLKKLAKHLIKKPRADRSAAPSPKRTRKALAGELMTSLQRHLTPAGEVAAEPSKSVTKTVKRLAVQLDTDRRKQAKRAAKAAKTIESPSPKPAPAKAAPAKTASAKAAPTKAAPAKAVPAKVAPVKTAPAKAALAQAE